MIFLYFNIIVSHLDPKSCWVKENVFSSPELKPFSDPILSFVRPSFCLSLCKLFTSLTDSTLGKGGSNVKSKDHAPFQVEIIRNYWKILKIFQKSSQKQISKKICMEPQGGGGGYIEKIEKRLKFSHQKQSGKTSLNLCGGILL